MKTKNFLISLAVVVVFFATLNLQAYYDPSTGRWFSRDPVNESGFQLLTSGKPRPFLSSYGYEEISDKYFSTVDEHHPLSYRNFSSGVVRLIGDINPYGFIGNDPLGWIDIWGLGTWTLSVKSAPESWYEPGVLVDAEYFTKKGCCYGYRMDRYARPWFVESMDPFPLWWRYDGNSGMNDQSHLGNDGSSSYPAIMFDQPGTQGYLLAYILPSIIDFRWDIHCLDKEGKESGNVLSTIQERLGIIGNSGNWIGHPGQTTITVSDGNN